MMNVYVKLGDIEGDSTHEDHPAWIEASTFHWGVSRAVVTEIGSPDDRLASHPVVDSITLVKKVDRATTFLLSEVTVGSHGKPCQIHICAGARQVICELELENALVTSVHLLTNGHGDDHLTEHVGISFTKVLFKYVTTESDNRTQYPSIFSYDIPTARGY